MKKSSKGPKRKVLLERLAASERQIGMLKQQNAKLTERLKVGDRLRRVGEHWYELIEYFDAEQIRRVPVGRANAHLMGMLQEAIVVEIPDGTSSEDMQAFSRSLKARGIPSPVLYIWKGVRFLRLATVPEELEARLDAAEEKSDEEPQEPRAAGDDAVGDGPEPPGNRLGGSEPSVVATARDGGDRDEAADEAGEEAPDGRGS